MGREQDRLNGWKEIATFLDKSVRTVQRWERDCRLPIHRQGAEGELIFAYGSELEAWVGAGGGAAAGRVAPAPGRRGERRTISPHCLIWQQRPYPLRQGRTVIGRADDADVQILLPSVSRHHAHILVRGLLATIEDVGSRHGTWCGSTRVTGTTTLASGDELRLGTAVLVYRFVQPTDTTI